MSEPRKLKREADVTVVVDDMDEAMGTKVVEKPSRHKDDAVDSMAPELAASLGREVYTWTSPYCEDVVARFRRPPGGTREMVARVLGAEQSGNQALVREYLALAAIVELNDERVSQPRTILTFGMLKKRIGFVGPGDDEWMDEPVNMYTFAFECAMYPEQLRMAAELEGAGLSPDDEKRILKNAGLDRPKA